MIHESKATLWLPSDEYCGFGPAVRLLKGIYRCAKEARTAVSGDTVQPVTIELSIRELVGIESSFRDRPTRGNSSS